MAGVDIIHLRSLLHDGAAEPLAQTIIQGARSAASKDETLILRNFMAEIPPEWRSQGLWPLAFAWVGLRSGESALIVEALAQGLSDRVDFFTGILAGRRKEPQRAAHLAAAEANGTDPVFRPLALELQAVAARHRNDGSWPATYERAIEAATGRDRGIIRSRYAYALKDTPARARTEFIKALPEVRTDPHFISEIWTQVAHIDLQAGLYAAAARAFNLALEAALQQKERRFDGHVYVGLGAVFSAMGAYPRAIHQYRRGLGQTTSIGQHYELRIAISLALAAMGRRSEALEEATLMTTEVAGMATEPQPCLSILAGMRMLNDDLTGAEEALQQAPTYSALDRLRWFVVRAELDRRAGDVDAAQRAMNEVNGELLRHMRTLGRLFPEVYALRGVTIETSPWTVRCSLAGPVRLWMYDIELQLRSTRPAAGLLALLVTHGGRVSRERALDALDLPGRTPDARRKALSAAVAELREVLGWPDSVVVRGGVLALSEEPTWLEPEYPGPGREDLFCEGRYDPWVVDWRSERAVLN